VIFEARLQQSLNVRWFNSALWETGDLYLTASEAGAAISYRPYKPLTATLTFPAGVEQSAINTAMLIISNRESRQQVYKGPRNPRETTELYA
jgi:hypothetical protein